MNRKTRRLIFLFSVLVFSAAASVAVLYGQGYSLDRNFTLTKGGGLYIGAPYTGSEIFIDNAQEKITNMLSSGLFVSSLKPTQYSVMVAKEGFWPWSKTLTVHEGYVTETRAFLLPKDPNGKIVLRGKFTNVWASPDGNMLVLVENDDKNYDLIFYRTDVDAFLSADAETKKLLSFNSIKSVYFENNSFIFYNGKNYVKAVFDISSNAVKAEVYAESVIEINDREKFTVKNDQKIWFTDNNEILIDWLKEDSSVPYYICDHSQKPCKEPVKIFQSNFQLRSVDFFPGRKDVIVLAVSNGVYALEIDKRGGQVLQPVYKGKNPALAAPRTGNVIWVLDEGALLKINLNVVN